MIVTELPEDTQWVIDALDSEFELIIFHDTKYLLDMNFEMTEDGIHLHQADYIKELVGSKVHILRGSGRFKKCTRASSYQGKLF